MGTTTLIETDTTTSATPPTAAIRIEDDNNNNSSRLVAVAVVATFLLIDEGRVAKLKEEVDEEEAVEPLPEALVVEEQIVAVLGPAGVVEVVDKPKAESRVGVGWIDESFSLSLSLPLFTYCVYILYIFGIMYIVQHYQPLVLYTHTRARIIYLYLQI